MIVEKKHTNPFIIFTDEKVIEIFTDISESVTTYNDEIFNIFDGNLDDFKETFPEVEIPNNED